MLNRRFLRIKVMQALYSFFQHDKADLAFFEKELFKSLDKIYELYISIIALVNDLHDLSMIMVDENKNKHLPNKNDLNPNLKFVNNTLLVSISNNKELKLQIEKRKISWQNETDVIRKIFNEIKNGELFKTYLESGISSIEEDRDFIISLIADNLSENEVLISLFEEKNIHWADDSFVAFNSVIRNFEDLINRHTQNWEIERIANMDKLLMEMALAEIIHLPNVPIKVSLNEYIDISKEYSTPNSKTFVNGVLDKIIAELKKDSRINKTGRGLKEN